MLVRLVSPHLLEFEIFFRNHKESSINQRSHLGISTNLAFNLGPSCQGVAPYWTVRISAQPWNTRLPVDSVNRCLYKWLNSMTYGRYNELVNEGIPHRIHGIYANITGVY